jgi:hypothetical protein
MSLVLIAVLASSLVAVVTALVREVRLRRALVRLLQQLLSRWRVHDSKQNASRCDSNDLGPELDRRL